MPSTTAAGPQARRSAAPAAAPATAGPVRPAAILAPSLPLGCAAHCLACTLQRYHTGSKQSQCLSPAGAHRAAAAATAPPPPINLAAQPLSTYSLPLRQPRLVSWLEACVKDAVRNLEQAPFVQLYLPGQGSDVIRRHKVSEDFVQAPQVRLVRCPLLPSTGSRHTPAAERVAAAALANARLHVMAERAARWRRCGRPSRSTCRAPSQRSWCWCTLSTWSGRRPSRPACAS